MLAWFKGATVDGSTWPTDGFVPDADRSHRVMRPERPDGACSCRHAQGKRSGDREKGCQQHHSPTSPTTGRAVLFNV